ncbi:phospholipase D-like domain-containing anti-phage protein [Caldimonas tepidiphila]|uniref:phospholipase D-like domain-containing anti-phage protein n=1 Tax=Caldimonas tepidiphila TaxID=2315841 RepID=UPI000E5A548D|nr:phospholipase D-like domain-containing anti-phage protein [Caldimonas tepidiphila]
MGGIQRFSSRRQRLDREFLAKRLEGAVSYRRIAGYFRSSIFELVGEEIGDIPDVRIVCNSELDVADIRVSQAARDASLKETWNAVSPATEALLYRDKYLKLYELLRQGNVQVRVVPKDKVFLHGKAGVIEYADGRKTSFMGSINESKSGFADNYEILWEDPAAEAVAWVDEEFEALWADSYPLPDAIIEEVERVAKRHEVRFEELKPAEVPAAAMVESPLYRAGEMLQPWQRAFVSIFLQHRETYGQARLLLADEVGVGKTLSMAGSALVAALLGDGKVLILCPSTLMFQWQTELKDRLGIPSAVWLSSRKCWQDENGHIIKNNQGAAGIRRCPSAIAIVSQGLIFHKADECDELLSLHFGTVVLDEGHKARVSRGISKKDYKPNNLLTFMTRLAKRTRHLVIGTATPIQTEVVELWDLLNLLNEGAGFVMGREFTSKWRNCEEALPIVKGEVTFSDPADVWELLKTPLPPSTEKDERLKSLRMTLDLDDRHHFSDRTYQDLDFASQMTLEEIASDKDFFKNNNPVLRHTVLRRRDVLEDMGLLERVEVDVHPDPKAPLGAYPGLILEGNGLMTNLPFNLAYQAAEEFTSLLGQRTKSAGFLKNLLLQRICSSFAAGRSTAQMMLDKRPIEDEEDIEDLENALDSLTDKEAECLRQIVAELGRPEARDPKLAAVNYFLDEHRTGAAPDNRTWAEHGCIIFSQYYDTAKWVASEIARTHPLHVVAVYAGAGKSGLFKGEEFSTIEREYIKGAVRRHEIKLVVATDAACEGLNLQTLGTLINVDLPWNPSKLEQRLGRIKRFGQVRRTVDMLNLVYAQTRDEKVYSVLSRRLKDKFDIFGSLPDTLDDKWIDDQERMSLELDKYIERRQAAKNSFEIRYQTRDSVDPGKERWELCSKVLAKTELLERLNEGW